MKKILITEDQKNIQDVLVEILELNGFEVSCASNGKEALSKIQGEHYDLLITDIIMPAMTGLSLIKEIKKQEKNIKVIAMSGGGRVSSEDYLKSAETIGVDGIIAKPFDFQELVTLVKKVIG